MKYKPIRPTLNTKFDYIKRVKMKTFLTILTLFFYLNANATTDRTYFVYFEKLYIQGSVIDDNTGCYDYYLEPKSFNYIYGTDDELINKIISRLRKDKPEVYDWTYSLTMKIETKDGDTYQTNTVIIKPKKKIKDWTTVKNEITASLIFSGYEVIFDFGNTKKTLTLDDLTLPYFDLVKPPKKGVKKNVPPKIGRSKTKKIKEKSSKGKTKLTVLLIIFSAILNIELIALLIFLRKKIRKQNINRT